MAEIYEPILAVRDLQAHLQAALEQPGLAAQTGASSPTPANAMPDLNLQATDLRLKERSKSYHVSELLQFHDQTFLRHAYRVLLGREPDTHGSQGYLDALRTGQINRLDVLARLRFSREGMRRNVPVEGLRLPALLRRSYRLPLVGPALRWLVSLARLPLLVRHVNQLEAHLIAQQEHIAAYANRLNRHYAAQEQKVLGQLAQLETQFRELEHQHHTTTANYAETTQLSLRHFTEEFNYALARLSEAQHENSQNYRQLTALLNQLESARQEQDEVRQKQTDAQAVQIAAQLAAQQKQLTAHGAYLAEQQKQLTAYVAQLATQELAARHLATEFTTRLTDFQTAQDETLQRLRAAQSVQIEQLTQRFTAQLEDWARQELAEKERLAARLDETTARVQENVGVLNQTNRRMDEITTTARARHDDLAARLAQTETGLSERLAATQANLSEQLNATHTDWAARLATAQADTTAVEAKMSTRLAAAETVQRTRLAQVTDNLRAQSEQAARQEQALKAVLAQQGERIERLLTLVRERARASLTAPESVPLNEADQRALDAFYVALEDRLRGSRDTILQRLRVYLPLLTENALGTPERPVLDVGCGRGEWMELLRAEGFTAQGVDVNRVLVGQCRALELRATEADALDYLRSLQDDSVGVVTCFHLVEHLPLETVLALLKETGRVLQPGGLALFETPNPRNVLVGSCNFYYDPTHRNPLPSPVLQFMLEAQGFTRVQVLNLNPSDAEPVAGDEDIVRRFNEYFYGPMDYAALGWKP